MKCTDVSELITAVLDGELAGKLQPSVDEHVKSCVRCRSELELGSITKTLIRRELKPVRVPRDLAARITQRVRQESYANSRSRSWLPAGKAPLFWRPLVAFAGAAALLLILIMLPSKTRHLHAQSNDADVINQTYYNFDKVLEGSIGPTFASNDPFAVRSFFAQNAYSRASIPSMKRCKLIGGMLSSYDSEPIAHVIYEMNGQPIYVYQTSLSSFLDHNCLKLPDEARRELLSKGRYVQQHNANCTLVLWVEDANLCCAVADMPKDDLLAYLDGK